MDEDRIGVLGICGGGGYAINAATTERRIKPVGTVTGANYGRLMRGGFSNLDPVGSLEKMAGLGPDASLALGALSVSISIVLLAVYVLFLFYSLVTHSSLFAGSHQVDGVSDHQPWPIGRSVVVLAVATIFVAWMSEILVSVIEPTAHKLGLSNAFVGVFVVAILGNAAEHATAITLRPRTAWTYRCRSQ